MTSTHGAIALVGSGEYTAAMAETDRALLEILGGPARGRVALIPAASGLEPGQPERWNAMGAAHFTALGAQVAPLPLLGRDDASAHEIVEALGRANFFYFSGGSPEHLTETLAGSAAWEVIRARAAQGAVVAGCSAGAMMLGGYVFRVRLVRSGHPPQWRPGLALAPGLAVLPHFDRTRQFLSEEQFRTALASAPPDATVVGIDEDTALVRSPAQGDAPRRWRVLGRQTVSVFDGAGEAAVYGAGEELELP
jgi:cyanophycinase